MIHAPSLERAKAYLDAQLAVPRHAPTGTAGKTEGGFVTISRESGTGGSTLGHLLAERLNTQPAEGVPPWTVFDQNLVEEVLRDQHLSPRLARFLPEDKVSELDASVRELVGLHPNLWMLVQQTKLLMRELARRGHAIIVGRGANFATASIPQGLHVRLIAPPSHRAANMARVLKVSVSEAASFNRRTDAARRDYVHSVFDADVAAPLAYDIVINTGRLSLEHAVDLLVELVPQPVAA